MAAPGFATVTCRLHLSAYSNSLQVKGAWWAHAVASAAECSSATYNVSVITLARMEKPQKYEEVSKKQKKLKTYKHRRIPEPQTEYGLAGRAGGGKSGHEASSESEPHKGLHEGRRGGHPDSGLPRHPW